MVATEVADAVEAGDAAEVSVGGAVVTRIKVLRNM